MRRQFSAVAKQKLILRPGLTSLYAVFESETFAEKKISKQDRYKYFVVSFFPVLSGHNSSTREKRGDQ
jgi:hypothetical protein